MEKAAFLTLLQEALDEMVEKQTEIFIRGDVIKEDDLPLFKEMHQEIQETQLFIKNGGELKQGLRYLQMNVFFKHESFFMDLFETNSFPKLFQLFEYE